MKEKRIGIIGGTFDPVHNAHLELAQRAAEQYQLDLILFIPAGNPVRKLGTTQASSTDRLNMLEAACAGQPRFRVSSIEADRPGITYTVDTLRELEQLLGQDSQLYLILGQDTALDLSTWKDADEIASLVTLLYAKRPSQTTDQAPKQPLSNGYGFQQIEMPLLDISSSQLRTKLAAGEDVSAFLPPTVLGYIEKYGLYAQPE